MKKEVLLIFAVSLMVIGCQSELRQINYNFNVSLQDSVLNDIEVGTDVSTNIFVTQKLEHPEYRFKFSYKEELGTILFSNKEVKDGEEVVINDVKNLRLTYRAIGVGKDSVHIDVSNKMNSHKLLLRVSSIAKTGVTFPAYSFYEKYSPNILVQPNQMLVINNPADKENRYKISFERIEGDDLQAWIVSGDEKREMTNKKEMNLFSGVGVNSYRFEFLSPNVGMKRFRFTVTDLYNNKFESDEYTIVFEAKGKVEFPFFDPNTSYSPNKRHQIEGVLKLKDITDNKNVFKVKYTPTKGNIMEISLIDGDKYYNLKKGEISLSPNSLNSSYRFEISGSKQGEQSFKLEVSDKYGNHYESDVYTIKFKAKAKISFPTIAEKIYTTNVENYIDGGRLQIQGIDDPNNEFEASYEILSGEGKDFRFFLVRDDTRMIGLEKDRKHTISKGTESNSFQYMIFQGKSGTTEFKITITDKYGNHYEQTYKAVFKDHFYGKVVVTMLAVNRHFPTEIDGSDGILEKANKRNPDDLKTWLADYPLIMNSKLEGEKSDRYIYEINVDLFSDPLCKNKKPSDFLFSTKDKLKVNFRAKSEVYYVEIFQDRMRMQRRGALIKKELSSFSFTLPVFRMAFIGLDHFALRPTIINLEVNKSYSSVPNTIHVSDRGRYPVGIFFGKLEEVESIGFAHANFLTKDIDFTLLPVVDIYLRDNLGQQAYFIKSLETNVVKY